MWNRVKYRSRILSSALCYRNKETNSSVNPKPSFIIIIIIIIIGENPLENGLVISKQSNQILQNADVCRVSKLFSLGIDHVLPLTFSFKQQSHLHGTKATFRTLSQKTTDQIKIFVASAVSKIHKLRTAKLRELEATMAN